MWKYIGTKECNKFLLSLNLINCKDENKYIKTLYSIANNVEANYRVYKIKKKNGKFRTIYEPNPLLKHIQRKILVNILNNKRISLYAKAYCKGITLLDNASPHVNKNVILKLDIKDFFENISFYDVYSSCFPIEYFPKTVGMLLTYLCTYDDHLTQGSPTSAYISNLVMKDFDEAVGSWCGYQKITYTRYSDDMTFSGDFSPSEVIIKVKKLLSKLGLELNKKKIHVVKRSSRQMIIGIVVNDKVQVDAKYRREIRKEMYYINKYGIHSHLKRCNIDISSQKYLGKLYGKVLYVLQIDDDNSEFLKYKDMIKKIMVC